MSPRIIAVSTRGVVIRKAHITVVARTGMKVMVLTAMVSTYYGLGLLLTEKQYIVLKFLHVVKIHRLPSFYRIFIEFFIESFI